MRAAVPDYLASSVERASSPGTRFSLYLRACESDSWRIRRDKRDVFRQTTEIDTDCRGMIQALNDRQRLLGDRDGGMVIEAIAHDSFTTGLGNEHTLENGFTFSSPHGVPFLPGSSVKGVVRRAAEELALFGDGNDGWDIVSVWWLFGFDANSAVFLDALDVQSEQGADSTSCVQRIWKEAYVESLDRVSDEDVSAFVDALPALGRGCSDAGRARKQLSSLGEKKNTARRREMALRGALVFRDVYPAPPLGSGLQVEIMNPHHSAYYGSAEERNPPPPGDWETPIPVLYLGLPAGTQFTFAVHFRPTVPCSDRVACRWQAMVERAFAHAFADCGFGAKTSQGFGRMLRDGEHEGGIREAFRERRRKWAQDKEEEKRAIERESLTGVDRLIFDLETADEAKAAEAYKMLEALDGDERVRLARALKAAFERLSKWSGKLSKKQKEKVRKVKQVLGEAT